MTKTKQRSKKKSTRTIIHGAVQKIQREFPSINKKIIEMYVSYLISIYGFKDDLDVNEMVYNIDNYINNNIDKMDRIITEYTDSLSKSIASCPCGR